MPTRTTDHDTLDPEVVHRARAGDHAAFTRLLREHDPQLRPTPARSGRHPRGGVAPGTIASRLSRAHAHMRQILQLDGGTTADRTNRNDR